MPRGYQRGASLRLRLVVHLSSTGLTHHLAFKRPDMVLAYFSVTQVNQEVPPNRVESAHLLLQDHNDAEFLVFSLADSEVSTAMLADWLRYSDAFFATGPNVCSGNPDSEPSFPTDEFLDKSASLHRDVFASIEYSSMIKYSVEHIFEII